MAKALFHELSRYSVIVMAAATSVPKAVDICSEQASVTSPAA